MENNEDIWADDLLDRRSEARMLEQYLTRNYRELGGSQAYTIAVDAGFGTGKTWFLRRLGRSLALNHPVAFIDAWMDDTADQPLTALMVAIEDAIEPLLAAASASNPVTKAWTRVKQERWTLARIASVGLLKRAAGFAITQQGVDAMTEAMGKEAAEKAADDNAEAIESVIDQLADTFARKEADAFRERRLSIDRFKQKLGFVIQGLQALGNRAHAPVFVIIDELDRCRPTYAVRLLEEVKHLFAVPGLIFIYGMHGEALGHSIKALYGSEFPADHYLRRFIRRRYQLVEQPLVRMIEVKIASGPLATADILLPRLDQPQGVSQTPLALLIDRYMRANELRARDIDPLFDLLNNFVRLWEGSGPIHGIPLLQQAIALVGNLREPIAPGLTVYPNTNVGMPLSTLSEHYKSWGGKVIDQVRLAGNADAGYSWLYSCLIQESNAIPDRERSINRPSWSAYGERIKQLGRIQMLTLEGTAEGAIDLTR